METAYFIFASFLVLATLIPMSPYQHWCVRGFDFGKIQLTLFESLTFVFGLYYIPRSPEFWVLQLLLMACQVYNLSILLKYSWLYPVAPRERSPIHSEDVTLMSANVLQFNTDYPRFIKQVRDNDPDMVLTMESNEDWDTAMRVLEPDYPYFCKVPLENTYGIHLYSKLKMTCQVHYFVADDLPSIEAEVLTEDGYPFTLFCVHPLEAQPTER